MMKRRCSKCFHELPMGRKTWKPRWGDKNCNDETQKRWREDFDLNDFTERYYLISDGPILGMIEKKYTDPNRAWNALILAPPSSYVSIGVYDSKREAKKKVQKAVAERKLWP